MNYTVKWSSRFKKQYKLLMKRGENIELLVNPESVKPISAIDIIHWSPSIREKASLNLTG